MQTDELTAERVRGLSATSGPGRTVLSLFLDLDPSRFGTAPARRSAIRSLLDEARREVDELDHASHAERQALREAVARAAGFLTTHFTAQGAHGLALFVCVPTGLFEVVRAARPVRPGIAIDVAPHVEPLARAVRDEHWAVALVSHADGRVLRGTPDRLQELAQSDDDVHGQHDQGGLSQPRHGGFDVDVLAHVERVLSRLERIHAEAPIDCLALGAPDEVRGAVDRSLTPPLRARLVGWIHVDVARATPDVVLTALAPLMERAEERRERELLDRLADALGRDERAATALESVLDALVQRRVATLLIGDRFAAPGRRCPACRWIGARGERCPVDGATLEALADVTEPAVDAAIGQAAGIIFVRHHEDELTAAGGIAALLRF